MIKFSTMAPIPVPAGGPATFHGLEYQLLWSLFHATQWKVEIGSDHGITAILEPESGIDFEYRLGRDRYVEQIKARSTGKPWSFTEIVREVLPSLYRCVEVEVPTAYVFVTETAMGKWQEVYDFFKRLREVPVPLPAAMPSMLDDKVKLKAGRASFTERTLFEHVVRELAGRSAGEEEWLKIWHLLRDFHFRGKQDYSALVRKIDHALANHGTPLAELGTKRTDLVGDLFTRASQGNGKLESTGFFKKHGLSEISLKRWVDVQARGRRYMLGCLDSLSYRRDWDVREVSTASSLFLVEPKPEEVMAPGSERLVSPRSAVLLTCGNGQGKSWLLYRLGYESAEGENMAVLIQGTGALASDLNEVAAVFCREIWGPSYVQSLQDLVDLVRRELPQVQQPWLTVLIDDVRGEEYALSLLKFPWQNLGLRVALGCRQIDRLAEGDVGNQMVPVIDFTQGELFRYLKTRLGVGWIDVPEDMRRHMTLPRFARLFCDLHGNDATWRPIDEYHFFERIWSRQTAASPLAGSAMAGLAAHLPEEQVYPWPLSRVWTSGLRDRELKVLVDSGLLRLTDSGRSLEVWHDRILNWAVAEGLVSALRSNEITIETLVSRAIYGQSDNPLHRRLDYVAMDTLWLLATPEFGLGAAVRQFLTALEEEWGAWTLQRNLSTLGERIVPYLFSQLASLEEEEE